MPIKGRGVPSQMEKIFNFVLFLASSLRYQNANNSVLAGSELIWKWFYYCFQNLELLPPQFENPWETNTSFFLHVGRNKINSGIQNDENRINREIWNDGRVGGDGEKLVTLEALGSGMFDVVTVLWALVSDSVWAADWSAADPLSQPQETSSR